MADQMNPPAELSLEEANLPPGELTYEEAHGTEQPAQHPGFAGQVAAGLRGVRESIPFGQDIGAAGTYMFGNPLTGEKAPETFEQAKREQMRKDDALYREHPYAYGTGFAAGTAGQMLAGSPYGIEAAGAKLAGKAAPYVGSKAADVVRRGTQAAESFLGAGNKVGDVTQRGVEAATRLAGSKLAGTPARRAVGELAGNIAGAAGTGALYGLGQGATLDERIKNMESGALFGTGVGAAGAGLSKLGRATGIIGKTAAPRFEKVMDDLKTKSQDAYDAARAAGVGVNPAVVSNFYDDVMRKLAAGRYRSGRHSELNDALRELYGKSKGPMTTPGAAMPKPVTLDDLEYMRQLSNDTHFSKDAKTRELGHLFRNELQNFTDRLRSPDLVTGMATSKEAAQKFKEGRDYFQRMKKTDELNKIVEKSLTAANNPNSTRNVNELVQSKLIKLRDMINEGKSKGWSPHEKEQIDKIIQSHGLMGKAASFDPLKSKGSAITALITAMHSPGIAAAGATGAHLARRHLDKVTEREMENLIRLVSEGGKPNILNRAPMKSLRPYNRAIRQMAVPFGSVDFKQDEQSMGREQRASGGKVGNRDYPAKRLNKIERALRKAQEALAIETKPLMQKPDEEIAAALNIAKEQQNGN